MTASTTSLPPLRKNRPQLSDSPDKQKILKTISHKYGLKTFGQRPVLKDTSNITQGGAVTFRPDNRFSENNSLAPQDKNSSLYEKQYVGKRGSRKSAGRVVGSRKRSAHAGVGRKPAPFRGTLADQWNRLHRIVDVKNIPRNGDVTGTHFSRSAKRDVRGSGSSKRGKDGKMTAGRLAGQGTLGSAHGSTDYFDTDFESDSSSECDDNGLQDYHTGCQVLGISPSPFVLSQWKGPRMNLNYKNLGPSGAKALTTALLKNPNVSRLEMEENRLGGIGGMYVCTYLKENVFITKLNLSRNHLGSMGAMAIGELMKSNHTIEHLNLSDNNFRDSDGDHIAVAIEVALRLTTLNLGHNGFSEEGATKIGRAICKNGSLEELDLSWNQLRRKGAGAICAAIKRNSNVTKANLAWNGLAYEGSVALSEMLNGNLYLLELDVTSNRINWEGARLVARGLSKNIYLQILRIGKNPLTTTGCYDLAHAVDTNAESQLAILDLSAVPVNKSTIAIYDAIKDKRSFSMPHGGVVEGEDVFGRRPEVKKDPIQVLMDFLTERGIRPVDLFRQLKQDDQKMVTKEAFLVGLQNAKVPMKTYEIEQILDSIESNAEGKISFNLLMKGVKDQIRVNREEEKRRLEMEDRFNEEKRRLMTLTPPENNVPKRKSKHRRKRKVKDRGLPEVKETQASDTESEEYKDDFEESEDELDRSQSLVDSRPVTPLPVMTIDIVRTPRGKKKPSLPGISDSNPLASKSQQHLSMTETVTKMKKKQTQPSRGHGANKYRYTEETPEKKPQRLLPLTDCKPLPTQEEKVETMMTARSLDTWQSLAPPASTLPSAQFSLSLNLTNNGKKQWLRPLEETDSNNRDRKKKGKNKSRTSTH